MITGSICVSATSQAVCVAGAASSGRELYDYIAGLRFGQVRSRSEVVLQNKHPHHLFQFKNLISKANH